MQNLEIGDTVRILHLEFDGINEPREVWMDGTVCFVDQTKFGVAFAGDGVRRMIARRSSSWKRNG